MDAEQFTKAIEKALLRQIGDFEVRIQRDNLPTSVEFLAISKEFNDISRAGRIQILAKAVEDAFGLPLEFGPMGFGLTPEELDNPPWTEDDENDRQFESLSDNGTAAQEL